MADTHSISEKECAEMRYRRRAGQSINRVVDEMGRSTAAITIHARGAQGCHHDQAIVGPPARQWTRGRDIEVEVPETITAERAEVMVGLRDERGGVTDNSVIVTGQRVGHEVSVLVETFASEFGDRLDYLHVEH
jgi:hypothetical protein